MEMMRENVEIAKAIGGVTLIILAITTAILAFIMPLIALYYLVIPMNWGSYWYWQSLVLVLSRILYFIMVALLIFFPFLNGKFQAWFYAICYLFMGIFGIPLLYDTLHNLIFIELTGIELQRAFLTYIILMFFCLLIGRASEDYIKLEKKENSS